MSLDKTLESTVTLSNYTKGVKITPKMTADRFHETVLSNPTSWVMGAILKHTVVGSSKHEMRDSISPFAVRLAYDGAVRAKVWGIGMESEGGATAHHLLSYIADDQRLSNAVNPKYVHSMFHMEMRPRSNGLRAATYFFQSTELSPTYRQEFTTEEVANLFSMLYEVKNWELISEVFKTTELTPSFRDNIKPQSLQKAFRNCLEILEDENGQGKYYAAEACKELLRYTISDGRYRGENGIDSSDIRRLKKYFNEIIGSKPKSTFDEMNHGVNVWRAKRDLEYVQVCTFPVDSCKDALMVLRDQYNKATGWASDLSGPDKWAAYACLRAVEAYPALKNG